MMPQTCMYACMYIRMYVLHVRNALKRIRGMHVYVRMYVLLNEMFYSAIFDDATDLYVCMYIRIYVSFMCAKRTKTNPWVADVCMCVSTLEGTF
jgi:hypothetical protein